MVVVNLSPGGVVGALRRPEVEGGRVQGLEEGRRRLGGLGCAAGSTVSLRHDVVDGWFLEKPIGCRQRQRVWLGEWFPVAGRRWWPKVPVGDGKAP